MPGTVALFVPYVILGPAVAEVLDSPWGLRQYVGLLIVASGGAVLAWSIVDFAIHGRGTLAPVDPPRELVVHGPYRYVRNPMYLGVLTILLGEALFFGSVSLLLYTAAAAVVFTAAVLGYEEPHLRRQFGEPYTRYVTSVRRWIPGPPYRG